MTRTSIEDLPPSAYSEQAPPPSLKSVLVCTWTQAIGAADHRQPVLPDACIDIVWIGLAAPVIVGPATRLFLAALPPRSLIVGARFRPGTAPPLLGLPAGEVTDTEIALREAWGGAADDLADAMAAQLEPERKLAVLCAALAQRSAAAPAVDRLVAAAVDWLCRHPAGRVRELARTLAVSPRQLQRRFVAAVGYGPKTFQRILRLQRVLAMAAGRPGLASLAAAAGYADQAHMTREVAALAGRIPGQLLPGAQSTLAMAEIFNTAEAACG